MSMRSASVRPQTQGQCITNGTRARECAKIVIDNAHAHYVHTTHARVHACATTTKKQRNQFCSHPFTLLRPCTEWLPFNHTHANSRTLGNYPSNQCLHACVCVCVPTHRHQIHTCWRQACGRAHASSLQQHGQLLRPVYISDVRTTTTRYK